MGHDIGDRQAVLLPEGHVNARHQREVKRHVAFLSVTEVGPHVARPLIGFRKDHSVGVVCVDLLPEPLDESVRFRKIFATGVFALKKVRNRVHP